MPYIPEDTVFDLNSPWLPEGVDSSVKLVSGWQHSLAIMPGGSVIGWGSSESGKSQVPSWLSDVVHVSAGFHHSLALTSYEDGIGYNVAAWGSNSHGQCSFPSVIREGPHGAWVAPYKDVAAGCFHSLGIVADDGSLRACGYLEYGQGACPSGEFVQVCAGWYVSIALRADGVVVGWGSPPYSPGWSYIPPAGLDDVIQISAINRHCLALRSDGTVVAWGQNVAGECDVPSGLGDVVEIAAGVDYSLARQSDGAVVAWGAAPSIPEDLVASEISAGGLHCLIRGNLMGLDWPIKQQNRRRRAAWMNMERPAVL